MHNMNAINSKLERDAFGSTPGPTTIKAYPVENFSPAPKQAMSVNVGASGIKAAPNPTIHNALDDLEMLLLGGGKKSTAAPPMNI